jgi:hypothetical protein
MKLIAKSLITFVLISSLTIPAAHGLETSDPNFIECNKTNLDPLVPVSLDPLVPSRYFTYFDKYLPLYINLVNYSLKKASRKQQKVLNSDKLKVKSALDTYSSTIQCESLTLTQWESIKQDRINSQSNADKLLISMIQKYPFTTISCFKNGIPQKVTGINPVCPKGTKQL